MKYIITESQYKLIKEEQKEILHFPNIDIFGGWDEIQLYLEKKGNPFYSIGGNLNLDYTPIKSLGNLTSVGGNLDLDYTPIKSLGNLTSVGGNLDLNKTPLSKKYTREEIRQMVEIKGDIYL